MSEDYKREMRDLEREQPVAERDRESEVLELSTLSPGDEGSQVAINARQKRWKKELIEWVKILLIAVLSGLFLRNFVIQRNVVEGSSMFPTLHDRDRVMVELVSKRFTNFERGDIVTIASDALPTYEYFKINQLEAPRLIKRVIALPGDVVELRDNRVYVNGEEIAEPYVNPGAKTLVGDPQYAKLTLAEDCYYVMGDNREHSKDSRFFGPVHSSDIVGKLWFRLYPYDHFGKVE